MKRDKDAYNSNLQNTDENTDHKLSRVYRASCK